MDGKTLKIALSNKLSVFGPPSWLSEKLKRKLTFVNPQYLKAQRMGRRTDAVDKYLRFYDQYGDTLSVPRGFTGQLIRYLQRCEVEFSLIDQRRVLSDVTFDFNGDLRKYQQRAIDALSRKHFGVLCAPTGSGKTVMALALVAIRQQPTLVIVHTRELLNQWIERIATFLKIPPAEIGVIGSGKKVVGNKITVALVQTLYKCADEIKNDIGHFVVDECHRTPSRTFTQAVSAFDSKYMLGLSATPWRRDKLSRLIYWYLGDLIFEIHKNELLQTGSILPIKVIKRRTSFVSRYDASSQYTRMLSELVRNDERNRLIALDVAREATKTPHALLVLTDRQVHCEKIANILEEYGLKPEILTGDLPNKKRKKIVQRLNAGQVKVLIATTQLIGEGFDCPNLGSLFLATPMTFDGRLMQALGRVLRPAENKDHARVFDYVDVNIGVLKASARKRDKVYSGFFQYV